jgi:hypothetical protein
VIEVLSKARDSAIAVLGKHGIVGNNQGVAVIKSGTCYMLPQNGAE